jgi:KRAB domain-containing zinc finger protein
VRKRKPKKRPDPNNLESYPCAVCGKVCASKGSLHSHEKSHRVMRPSDYYYCDLCGNKFREKCPLKVHIKKRHVQKIRYVCDACPGKSWATNHQLKRHIKIYHYNIREFKCEWCGKEFADKSKLVCHIRIHTGEL